MFRMHSEDTTKHIKKGIALFPNPASSIVNVVATLEPDETGIVELYNMTGMKVEDFKIAGGITINPISISNLSNGVYGYRLLTTKNYNARGKLVITK